MNPAIAEKLAIAERNLQPIKSNASDMHKLAVQNAQIARVVPPSTTIDWPVR